MLNADITTSSLKWVERILNTYGETHIINKTELVSAIAEEAGLTKADAAKALEATVSTITKALSSGDSVAIIGFGTFKVGERSARTGRNPQTGAEMQIPAAKVPKFSAGKALKDAVN